MKLRETGDKRKKGIERRTSTRFAPGISPLISLMIFAFAAASNFSSLTVNSVFSTGFSSSVTASVAAPPTGAADDAAGMAISEMFSRVLSRATSSEVSKRVNDAINSTIVSSLPLLASSGVAFDKVRVDTDKNLAIGAL